MRGYFDEDEPETRRPRRDHELTLGAGALLGLFFVLVLVCGFCFGMGYTMGHRSAVRSAAAGGPTAAPDQEPLQGNDSIPKPSAAQTAPIPLSDEPPTAPAAGTAAIGASTTAPGESAAANGQGATAPGAADGTAPQQVQPALPAAGNPAPAAQGAAPNVQPALPNQARLMVQIAAVANPEDADVLETALRKRGYAVTAARDPADGLIHVKIGPFMTLDEANRWRDKLLGDGYNAFVQP